MTQEFDHGHQHTSSSTESRDVDRDPHPGRASRSALMRKPDHAIVSGLLSRAARAANGVAADAEAAVAAAGSSTGAPLPATLMRKFESSLGADLGGVRVHTGEASAAANDAVGARAYTLGQDIHFGAGQYDPSSPAGEHLLAHEVAHTVQQGGGAQRMQFQLAVSSPGDAHEHEADRAASAMVSGQATSVSFGSGVSRKVIGEKKPEEGEKSKTVEGGEIELPGIELELGQIGLGPFELTPKVSAHVSLSPTGSDKEGNEKPTSISGGMSTDSVKLSAEKEFGEKTWGWQPKLKGSAEVDKEGKPTMSYGLGIEHEGYKFDDTQLGPFSLEVTVFEWKAGEAKPKILTVAPKIAVTKTSKASFMGYHVVGKLEGEIEIEPNYVEIGKWIAEQGAAAIASGAAGAAAAIAAPLIAAAGMLYAWSKAGHEFDEVQARIENLRARCHVACQEAMTGKHVAMSLLGKDLNENSTQMAADIKAALIEKLKIPAGAFPAIAAARPGIASQLYQTAWAKTWPDLKSKIAEQYVDTTFKSYKFERQWLDGFDTGDFSKG